jgi:hypothetical protein
VDGEQLTEKEFNERTDKMSIDGTAMFAQAYAVGEESPTRENFSTEYVYSESDKTIPLPVKLFKKMFEAQIEQTRLLEEILDKLVLLEERGGRMRSIAGTGKQQRREAQSREEE